MKLSNKKVDLINFYEIFSLANGIISKSLIDQLYYANDKGVYDFNSTFIVDENMISKIPDQFALSLFQERIKGDYEIRVVNIDMELYAMAIFNLKKTVDYRGNFNIKNGLRKVPYNLPMEISEKLILLYKKLNLNFGSADLIFKNGNYYFLEINPSGQIDFVTESCNYYLEKKLAQTLQRNDKT